MSCEISDMHPIRASINKEKAINYTNYRVIHFKDVRMDLAGNIEEGKMKCDENATK